MSSLWPALLLLQIVIEASQGMATYSPGYSGLIALD